MEPTAFWRDDIEDRFRKLHDEEQLQEKPFDVLHALWRSKGFGTDNPWALGGSTDHVRTGFEWVAERAAVQLGHPGGPTAVAFWLDRLKAESPYYKSGTQSSTEIKKELGRSENGQPTPRVLSDFFYPETITEHSEGGVIEFVCKASADYCLKCETREIVQQRAQAPIGDTPRQQQSPQEGRVPSSTPGQAGESKQKSSSPKGLEGLPAKKLDMTNYFGSLSDRQRGCASLKYEYGLKLAEISSRLELHHSTVQEALAAAETKMQYVRKAEKTKANLVKIKPGGLDQADELDQE